MLDMAKKKTQRGGQSGKERDAHTVRFPPGMKQIMEELALKHDRSLTGEIVWAVRQYLGERYADPENGNGA